MPDLDKFYTQKQVAKQCFEFLNTQLHIPTETTYLEPSAGGGAFLDLLPKYVALDIAPEDDRIQQQNYLTYTPNYCNFVTIGNPPFGKRSKLAIDFFNKAATMSDVIAFIIPVSFMKWSVQKQLDHSFKLHSYMYLEPESFSANGEPYSVRTVFQIWVKTGSQYDINIDLRLTKSPPIKHEDFEIWQYNATPEAVKYVDENWTYAVRRQGYHDYNEIFTRKDYDFIKEKMTGQKKQQFFFIRPLTDAADKLILNMDFNALAERNTATPGFGKADFVSYYMELKETNHEFTV